MGNERRFNNRTQQTLATLKAAIDKAIERHTIEIHKLEAAKRRLDTIVPVDSIEGGAKRPESGRLPAGTPKRLVMEMLTKNGAMTIRSIGIAVETEHNITLRDSTLRRAISQLTDEGTVRQRTDGKIEAMSVMDDNNDDLPF